MLSRRIIPTILCRGRQMVKGTQFNAWRSVGLAAQAVRIHAMRGVDEVCLLDIAATPDGRGPDLDLVSELSDSLYSPLTVGGGVRSVNDVKALLRSGADKVLIGTGAYEVPDLVRDCSDRFGSQAITVAIDVGYQSTVMIRCGKVGYSHDPLYCAGWAERAGAGEILLTSIDREGTMRGYDLALIRQVSQAVSIPVIAHGGAGCVDDLRLAIEAGADAVAAGAIFLFTEDTPKLAAQHLHQHGIEVRL